MSNQEENKEKVSVASQGVKTVTTTVAGASLGVAGGIAAITAVAVAEIILPVALCLWTAGVAGGAIGLLIGTRKRRK
ncbi:MAG: hypothetical protein KAI63_03055 [Planctomycetes bacterium]|nr:hypothetical protein [Planctomycetota bacterium]